MYISTVVSFLTGLCIYICVSAHTPTCVSSAALHFHSNAANIKKCLKYYDADCISYLQWKRHRQVFSNFVAFPYS